MTFSKRPAPTPFMRRLLAALILVAALFALRLGLTHAQSHDALFWLVTAGFALQALACAAYLIVALLCRARCDEPWNQPAA